MGGAQTQDIDLITLYKKATHLSGTSTASVFPFPFFNDADMITQAVNDTMVPKSLLASYPTKV